MQGVKTLYPATKKRSILQPKKGESIETEENDGKIREID
jgi:hypothetical protein